MTTAGKDTRETLARFKARLPTGLHGRLDALAGMAAPEGDLRLIVLGAFSVGKSSLLNMLIGEPRLHVAKEEATSLPTFIEYGAACAMTLVGADGSVLSLDDAGFRAATSSAPSGAACATLALPLPWLRGVTVVDLPGLGSVSSMRRQYTAAQVLQADAVLYLLDPRGPGQADIDALRTIAQYGKRVKVMVTRWDDVDAARGRGEPVPRLEAWAAQIESHAGLRVRLAGASRDGLGRDELLEFVARARDDLTAIRHRRFEAELRPLLENALGENELAQRASAADSEEAARLLHADLMERKQDLLGLKSEIYARQRDDKASAQRDAAQVNADQRRLLERQLRQLAEAVQDEPAWGCFQSEGEAQLRQAVAALASALSVQSGRYGELALPEAKLERLNLRVPPLALVDSATFVETAKLAALERVVLEQQARVEQSERQLAALPEVQLAGVENALHDKLRMQTELANQPLEYVTEVVPGNGAAAIGRIVGELADVGLMFFNPASAATKAGALIAKGAKVVKVTVDAKKVATAIKSGVRTVQALKGGKGAKVIPEPVRDKLSMLEALSLGYWGERIGSMLGGAAQERMVIDPEARAAQEQALAVLDQEVLQARRELARTQDMFNERQLTGWALEQGQRELARLAQEAQGLTEKRQARERALLAQAENEQRIALQRLAERGVQGLLGAYDDQGATMIGLLAEHVAAYWEAEVEAAIAQRMAGVDALTARTQDDAQARMQALASLRAEAQALRLCLEDLA